MHPPHAPSAGDLRWHDLARAEQLAVLVELDGTLLHHAASPEHAVFDQDVIDTLVELREVGVRVVIVSGRPSPSIDALRPRVPGAWWVAEHGSWRWNDHGCMRPGIAQELDGLCARLAPLLATPGARSERKSLSACIHWRQVDEAERAPLIAAVDRVCDEWLEDHPGFERLIGVEMLEIRQRTAHKGLAVTWTREQLPGVRIIALGHDVTDEDMFAELEDGDAAIAVGERCQRRRADGAVEGPAAVRAFLRWIVDTRKGAERRAPVLPVLRAPERVRFPLVVMSNRTPIHVHGRDREVGGLVSALEPALRDERGVWLGWSGREEVGGGRVALDLDTRPARATFELTAAMREHYYAGFCNSVLWPLLHGFTTHVRYTEESWQAYVRTNERFARHALELAERGATIWVHDYHLLLAARALRGLGHQGRIGLFLHVPFPSTDVIESVPWGAGLLDAMLDFDLVGFQTEQWGTNFLAAAQSAGKTICEDGSVAEDHRRTEVGVFPATIDPGVFRAKLPELPEIAALRTTLGERSLVLAVDRLDYSKGIPERLLAFERLLEQSPAWRGRVCLFQIAVPSRAELPAYAELRHRVEQLVGRINGRFGETSWVPVRYVSRAYDQATLAQLYRLADVALVTPLRDGMNLVAKEFVAAQDPTAPGVLVLSQHAGAAETMRAAVITNPFQTSRLAADLAGALEMSHGERVARHRSLAQALEQAGSPADWANTFLDRLGRRPLRAVPERASYLGRSQRQAARERR